MAKNHIKRINAPKRWNILRKNNTFISRPNPGRSLDLTLALNTVLKEMLGKTKTTKETKYLLKNQGVLVNGTRRWDDKFPVGFLDVVTMPTSDEHFRLIVNSQNKLELVSIPSSEATLKISKVSNKTHLKNGMFQINCSDGRNFRFKKDDKLVKEIATNDAIVYSIPDQKVKETLKLQKGSLVFLYNGKHIGQLVQVADFKGSNIVFKLNDEMLETKKSYAFVIGKDKPVITVVHHAHEHGKDHKKK